MHTGKRGSYHGCVKTFQNDLRKEMYYMRWILKTILFPIILLLSILISFLKFIISVSGMILGILSFLVILGSLAALIQKDTTTFIQALVIAFLISPYGLPKIALWVTAYIEFARDRLKEI